MKNVLKLILLSLVMAIAPTSNARSIESLKKGWVKKSLKITTHAQRNLLLTNVRNAIALLNMVIARNLSDEQRKELNLKDWGRTFSNEELQDLIVFLTKLQITIYEKKITHGKTSGDFHLKITLGNKKKASKHKRKPGVFESFFNTIDGVVDTVDAFANAIDNISIKVS